MQGDGGSDGGVKCTVCGFVDEGNFCSNCGAELRDEEHGAISALAHDVFKINEQRGYLSTWLQILRAPVRNTLALVADGTYRNHGAFFLGGTAVYLALIFFTVGRNDNILLPENLNEPARAFFKANASAIWTFLSYVWFVIFVPLSYMLFGLVSGEKKSAREFIKLACLMVGTTMPLSGIFGAGLILANAQSNYSVLVASLLAYIIFACWGFSYIFRLHKNYWALPMGMAVFMFVVCVALMSGASELLMYGFTHALNAAAPMFDLS